MGQPAARVGDMHVCPMVTPGVPPVPHVGGPVLPPGCLTVLIGGQPAARVGDMCTCVGPPDTIAKGSTGVMIGGMPAARVGDLTIHGGSISLGFLTVLIGEIMPSPPPVVIPPVVSRSSQSDSSKSGKAANQLRDAIKNAPEVAITQEIDISKTGISDKIMDGVENYLENGEIAIIRGSNPAGIDYQEKIGYAAKPPFADLGAGINEKLHTSRAFLK